MKKTHKKIFAVVLALLMLMTNILAVDISTLDTDYETWENNITWTFDDEGKLTISGDGLIHWRIFDKDFFESLNNTRELIIEDGITDIEDGLFASCANLEIIDMPDSMENIGDFAFAECYELENVKIPDTVKSIGNKAFYYCENLKSIKIPNNVTHINDYTFFRCNSLESVEIPNNVVTIDSNAFHLCENLTIYGYAGSYAETYATEKSIPFVKTVSFSTSMQAYLNLESIISMTVGFKFADMQNINPKDYTDKVGLLIWDAENAPEEAAATYENCENVIEGAVYNSSLSRFETTTDGIIAKELGDQLCFRAYHLNSDGSYTYSRYITNYSPKTYCYNQIKNNPDDEATIELMSSILNYGAAAQKYFNYKTDNLMNSDLPEELK